MIIKDDFDFVVGPTPRHKGYARRSIRVSVIPVSFWLRKSLVVVRMSTLWLPRLCVS